jgi:hypothetical protein
MVKSPEYTVEKKEDKFEIRRYPDYILAQVDVSAEFDEAISIGFSILAHYIFGGNKKKSSIPMTTPVTDETLSSEKIAMTAPVIQEEVGKSEKIAMTAPVTEEAVEKPEKIPMAAPVIQEEVGKSEKIAMTAPVTEEEAGEKVYRISFTMPANYTLETLPEPEDRRIKFKEVENQRTAVLRFSGRVKEKLAREKIQELKNWLQKNDIKPKSGFIVAQYNNPAVPGFLRKNEIIVEI